MKRTILIVLCLAAAGTFAIVQAEEDIETPDCGNCETVDEECCCDGAVDGCSEDCSNCDTECEDCDSDCDDCTGEDCECADCTSEDDEFQHCGGCH